MRRSRTAILACGLVALLGVTLSVPAAGAGTGRILFVQGRPDVTVDICVGNVEIASRLAYGDSRARRLSAGTKVIRFAKAAPGACTGTSLATRRRPVTAGSDTTVVLTRFAPRVVVYPQTPGVPGSPVGQFVLRHAADIGRAGFRYTSDQSIPWYPEPAVDAPFRKGDWGVGTAVADLRMFWWAHRPPEQAVIAGPVELVVEASVRHELVLVGTTLGNLELIRIDSPT
jgi:hypothetical protein